MISYFQLSSFVRSLRGCKKPITFFEVRRQIIDKFDLVLDAEIHWEVCFGQSRYYQICIHLQQLFIQKRQFRSCTQPGMRFQCNQVFTEPQIGYIPRELSTVRLLMALSFSQLLVQIDNSMFRSTSGRLYAVLSRDTIQRRIIEYEGDFDRVLCECRHCQVIKPFKFRT